MHHINALFDLENGIYTDVLVQKEHEKDELKALRGMADRSTISDPVPPMLADRNYESCNNLAHLEKRGWKYVIRLRERASVSGVTLPDQPEFNLPLRLTLGRLTARQLEQRGLAIPNLYYRVPNSVTFDFLKPGNDSFYSLHFRVVRVQADSGQTVTLLANLDPEQFPPDVLKQLFAKPSPA